MISRKDLLKNLKEEFPRIKKHGDYANLLLEGAKLRSHSRDSSKKRSDFLKSGKVKTHVFVNAYTKLDLLVTMQQADRITVLVSARFKFIFSFARAQQILDHEKGLLFKHIILEPRITTIVAKALKLPTGATLNAIRNKMNSGHVMKQASLYNDVFLALRKQNITLKGYAWFGVRTIPISRYYLSKKSKKLLGK